MANCGLKLQKCIGKVKNLIFVLFISLQNSLISPNLNLFKSFILLNFYIKIMFAIYHRNIKMYINSIYSYYI